MIWEFIKRLFQVKHTITTFPEIPELPEIKETIVTNRERLYDISKTCLARDVSPNDIAPDEYGCVESFDNIHKLTFGEYINGTTNIPTVSTIIAYKILSNSPKWEKVNVPLHGDVALCVTGKGNGKVSNGHIAIVGIHKYMSNSSYSGNWEANYTPETWRNYYELKGGFVTRYFRRK